MQSGSGAGGPPHQTKRCNNRESVARWASFWQRLKQTSGFYSRGEIPQAIFGQSGLLLSDPSEVLRDWRSFYSSIGNLPDEASEEARRNNPLDEQFKTDIERKLGVLLRRAVVLNPRLDAPFTLDELKAGLKALRRGGATGPDDVPSAFLELMGPVALDATLLLFNRIWISGHWPERWREGLIIPLFKGHGGQRTNIGDYRPITLTSCVAKLFENLLQRRLQVWCDEALLLCEEQAGFRTGRNTLEHLFTLHELVGARRERKRRTWMAFLDARRAYDRVWRSALLLKLWKGSVRGRMFHFIDSMLRDVRRRVLVNGQQSDPV